MSEPDSSETFKIIFFITEDVIFYTRRLALARAIKQAGHDLIIVTRIRDHATIIEAEGFGLIPIKTLRRGGISLIEIKTLWELFRIIKMTQPDMVHNMSLKPAMYGTLVAKILRVPNVVNTLTGMGYVFSSTQHKARYLQWIIRKTIRPLLNSRRCVTIVENPDDYDLLVKSVGLSSERVKICCASGVDIDIFTPSDEPGGVPVVLLATRMLRDKGVFEFVESARRLKNRGINARFVLAGDIDLENPTTVQTAELEAWQQDELIEWWGLMDNMPDVIAQAHIVCLPSFREGLPTILIEAAACAKPIIATDVPGCREIVRNNENGLLVPLRDVPALADAIELLIGNETLRRDMGLRGRQIVEEEFSLDKVIAETLSIYQEMRA